MQLKPGTNNNHTTCGVVDPFTEQVLAETSLLALDHICQRLQRSVTASQHGAFAPVVVKQRIDRLLQHSFLVTNDHFGRVEIDQLAQPVIAIDNATIEIIKVAGGKIPTVQQHQRTQVGRDHRNHIQDHPLRFVITIPDRLDNLQAIGEIFTLLLGLGFGQLNPQLFGQTDQIKVHQELSNSLGAHFGFETAVTVLRTGRTVFLFGEQLLRFQFGSARVNNDVVLEIDHLLKARRLHVKQIAESTRHGLEKPNMDNRSRKFDVSHSLATNP